MKFLNKLMSLKTLFNLFNFIFSFLFCRWFYMNYLYFYSIGILGFSESGRDFWRPFIAIMIFTLITYTLLNSVFRKRLNRNLVKLTYLCYFFVLIFVLFFKNYGVQGANLNLIKYFYDAFFIDSIVPLLNILIFIPLGLLFKFNYKYIGFFVLGIILSEIIQYVLSIGIFDIGDILLNTVGFILGNCIRDTFLMEKIIKLIK